MLFSISCARYEGFSDCKAYPQMDIDNLISMVDDSINLPEVKNKVYNTQQKPWASQIQMMMGSEGVMECNFTGL
jgi:hypothetical protein